MVRVEFKKLYEDSTVPRKAHESDAGFDLYAHSVWKCRDNGLVEKNKNPVYPLGDESGPVRMWVVYPGERILVKVGIGMSMPVGYEAQVRPRSGLALKNGITVVNSPGTIDSGYRDEVGVILLNTSKEHHFTIAPGERIAQLVIQKLPEVEVVEVDELSVPSERGNAGFGSSGK
jgi:dUTP pyrophosphatase